MTPDDLAAAGRLLYGEHWRRSLAAALDVDERLVRAWLAAKRPIPPHRQQAIVDLVAAIFLSQVTRQIRLMGSVPSVLTLTVYQTDDDLRVLTGERWTADFHHRLMSRIATLCTDAGIPARLAALDRPAYEAWLAQTGRPNDPASRTAFATAP